MRGCWLVLVLAACGSVSNEKKDAAVHDGPADSKSADAPLDAFSGCLTDEFNASSLDAHWVQTVGAAPTLTEGTGLLTITDAAFAASAMPTQPNESWIYDFDGDKGNQMRWDAPVGTRDFTLTGVIGWDTASVDLTYGGFGLVSAGNQLEALIAMRDTSSASTQYGALYAQVHVPGAADKGWANTGTVQTQTPVMIVLKRVGTVMLVEYNGNVVLSQDNTADIVGLVIVTVRYKDDNLGPFNYGTVTFDRVSLCM